MSSRPQTFSAFGLRNCGRNDILQTPREQHSMNEANIEYRVRGPIKNLLQLNRCCKQTVIASRLISAKNFEE